MKKRWIVIAAALIFALVLGVGALAAEDDYGEADLNGWIFEDGHWHYYDDGWMYQDGVWYIDEGGEDQTAYFFDADGNMLIGWQYDSWWYYDENDQRVDAGDWYYFDNDGRGHNGWLYSGGYWYYLDNGRMHNDGTWPVGSGDNMVMYAFDENGHMITGWFCETYSYRDENGNRVSGTNWFYFDPSGAGHNGWLYDGGYWYYLDNGYMFVDGIRYAPSGEGEPWVPYLFAADGRMLTNRWYSETSTREDGTSFVEWYYFGADGAGYNGWLYSGGYWYFLEDGRMYFDGVYSVSLDDYKTYETYRFAADGHLLTDAGWFSETYTYEDGSSHTYWYYFDQGGKGHNGWLYDGGKWYYIDHGDMVTGVSYVESADAYYAFGADGVFLGKTGWYAEEWMDWRTEETYLQWFYFDSSGKGITGWQQDGSNWYYLRGGLMVQNGTIKIGGTVYAFDANGYLMNGSGWKEVLSGWFQENNGRWYRYIGGWCYLSNGTALTGWQQMGGVWYYFNTETGIMATYRERVGDLVYTFDENGVWDGNPGVYDPYW